MNADVISRKEVLRQLSALKEPLRFRFGVTRLGIFGSVARGDANNQSDIDVVVEMAPNLFLRAALKVELESLLHHPVDVVRFSLGDNAPEQVHDVLGFQRAPDRAQLQLLEQ
ncbi:MAG TPA: nucleotidyltransferase domain-containing protein [Thermoflexales bacterium]|nr:nucleotidyltransferase domain-containing protein [Thermoflexales bacterium]